MTSTRRLAWLGVIVAVALGTTVRGQGVTMGDIIARGREYERKNLVDGYVGGH
jgi:hypothetical protein